MCGFVAAGFGDNAKSHVHPIVALDECTAVEIAILKANVDKFVLAAPHVVRGLHRASGQISS
jgi:hypothetical protein